MKLYQYIIKRLLFIIPVLLGVSVIVFSLSRLTGDPAAAYINEKMNAAQIAAVKAKYHFDEPVINQFYYWLKGIVQGDWGWSKVDSMPVIESIQTHFPATFELALVAMIIAVMVGIALGTASAVRRNKPFDHATRVVSLVGVSIPIFWLALMFVYVFYSQLDWFPAGSRYSDRFIGTGINDGTGFLLIDSIASGNFDLFKDVVWHLVMPATVLAFGSIAVITRIMRNSMLEVLGLDYVKTARAKGLPEKIVIKKHARKNAMIPTTTVIGLSFGGLLGGAVLTESIFSWPGLGRWSTRSISKFDTNSVLGFCLLIAFIYVTVNLIVDIIYAYLDPRVRLE
ncbi:MAG: ABC transporter permease [Methanomassiliicoccales archaeon]|jgi:peptide/nickel transport system permease protein